VSIAACLHRCLNPHKWPEKFDSSSCVDSADVACVRDFFCKSELFDAGRLEVCFYFTLLSSTLSVLFIFCHVYFDFCCLGRAAHVFSTLSHTTW